jgi:hypothetical protein
MSRRDVCAQLAHGGAGMAAQVYQSPSVQTKAMTEEAT